MTHFSVFELTNSYKTLQKIKIFHLPLQCNELLTFAIKTSKFYFVELFI